MAGIHGAKFLAERDPDHLRHAVERLGIEHPVAHDAHFAVGQLLGTDALPTVYLFDSDGQLRHTYRGEIRASQVARHLRPWIEAARSCPARAHQPPSHNPHQESGPALLPTRLLADGHGHLYISDSRRHRVLKIQLDERGPGASGRQPGTISRSLTRTEGAPLRHPSGLALDRGLGRAGTLFVADSGNHRLLALDLGVANPGWRPVAGTEARGEAPLPFPGSPSGSGTATALRGPRDLLCPRPGMLLVSLAGSHQIACLTGGALGLLAGSGAEELTDGPLPEAAFAQPGGLAWGSGQLWVADAESSSLRSLRLRPGPGGEPAGVATRVGRGLFEWGDRDGPASEARMQHPEGIAWKPKGVAPLPKEAFLMVADTYNHKIRAFHPGSERLSTLLGPEGVEGGLRYPEGVALDSDAAVVYIADTGHGRVLAWDGRASWEVEIS